MTGSNIIGSFMLIQSLKTVRIKQTYRFHIIRAVLCDSITILVLNIFAYQWEVPFWTRGATVFNIQKMVLFVYGCMYCMNSSAFFHTNLNIQCATAPKIAFSKFRNISDGRPTDCFKSMHLCTAECRLDKIVILVYNTDDLYLTQDMLNV